MRALRTAAIAACLLAATRAQADEGVGQINMRATNWTAIAMFILFVAVTLGITWWAAQRTRSASVVLHRRRRHHRFAERAGDRRRLHVGGVVPWHFFAGLFQRL